MATSYQIKCSYEWGGDDCGGEFSFYPGELLAFRPPPDLTVSQWADSRRILQAGVSRSPGPWSTDVTPYLREPMDMYNNPDVRQVVMCFGTQLGKTECLYNILGYIIDLDPYATLLLYPREDDGKTISQTRIQPMIEDCQSLRDKKPDQKKLYKTLEMHFNGMPLYIVGANSAAGMSQKPCRNLLRDEVDKYPDSVQQDADPLSLTSERQKAYWDIRKTIDVSSPTFPGRGIWALLNSCNAIRRYYVPCPKCNAFQRIEFKNIKFESVKDEGWDKRIHIAKNTAYLECFSCGAAITDRYKQAMLSSGEYRDDEVCQYEPEKIGYHVWSGYSPFLTFGDVVEEFLESLRKWKEGGTKTRLQNFTNGWRALPWEELGERKEEDIRRLVEPRQTGMVPGGALGLTCGVDTQDNGFYYVVRAWGRFFESWPVKYGFIDSTEALGELLFNSVFFDSDNKNYNIRFTLQDAMGHRTKDVYDFVRGRSSILPTQGRDRMAAMTSITKIDTYPGTNVQIPGGVRLLGVNTTAYKDKLADKLLVDPGSPGAFHLAEDMTDDYFSQMTAEYKDDKGRWVCPPGKANHYWDCEVLAFVAADYINLCHVKETAKSANTEPSTSSFVNRPNWATGNRSFSIRR